MEIGTTLREVRKSKKLTQVKVCGKINISQTFLSQIEGGKEPSPTMLRKLCKFYKIPYQVVIWKSLTEKDIQKDKKELFNQLHPIMNKLIDEILIQPKPNERK